MAGSPPPTKIPTFSRPWSEILVAWRRKTFFNLQRSFSDTLRKRRMVWSHPWRPVLYVVFSMYCRKLWRIFHLKICRSPNGKGVVFDRECWPKLQPPRITLRNGESQYQLISANFEMQKRWVLFAWGSLGPTIDGCRYEKVPCQEVPSHQMDPSWLLNLLLDYTSTHLTVIYDIPTICRLWFHARITYHSSYRRCAHTGRISTPLIPSRFRSLVCEHANF